MKRSRTTDLILLVLVKCCYFKTLYHFLWLHQESMKLTCWGRSTLKKTTTKSKLLINAISKQGFRVCHLQGKKVSSSDAGQFFFFFKGFECSLPLKRKIQCFHKRLLLIMINKPMLFDCIPKCIIFFLSLRQATLINSTLLWSRLYIEQPHTVSTTVQQYTIPANFEIYLLNNFKDVW